MSAFHTTSSNMDSEILSYYHNIYKYKTKKEMICKFWKNKLCLPKYFSPLTRQYIGIAMTSISDVSMYLNIENKITGKKKQLL